MTLVVSITLDDVYEALGDFLETVLPAGVVVLQSTENRVPEPPASPGFVEMTARVQGRIMTNLDKWNPQDVAPTEIDIEQAIQLTVQLDCYGAASGDWAVMLSTVLRDEYSIDALRASPITPLYTNDPRFAPLVSGEEQYERRWIVEAFVQYNPVTSTPQQFADTIDVGLINVDVSYPP
jgi:hypothetical protein